MINRILIRIKVLQIVYSYYQTESKDLKAAESELLFSLRKSYDLYHYFLLLIVELTNLQRRIIDSKKNKFMPSQEELNPNTKFIDNRFAMQVAQNLQLQKYCSEHAIVWEADDN
ncbi:MAG: transcription antitermination factor NusB, partial [Tannerellaceae bacterium]